MTDKNKSGSRRSFLTGWLENVDSVNKNDESSGFDLPNRSPILTDRKNSHFEVFSKNAMACQFELLFNMQQYAFAGSAALSAFKLIDDFEEQMTVYRETSEVSFINRAAATESVEVETRLYQLIQLAIKISSETDGAFDITSWPLSDLWGFSRREGAVPDANDVDQTLQKVGYRQCELNDGQLRFMIPDLKINLGGIGKGFALDHAAELITNNKITDFAFHGGQSSVLARGDNSTPSSKYGWNIGLSHPIIPNERIAEIRLCDCALGTSGTGRQGFFFDGKRYGHIIDPRTGYPTDHFYSTTVVAPSAAQADALATAFFVMSLMEIQGYCDSHPEISAVIINKKANPSDYEIETFNVDPELLTIK